MKKSRIIIALANAAEHAVVFSSASAIAAQADIVDVLGLENILSQDTDGWALLAPFGEHRKERMANVNGQLVHEKYVQVVDQEAVDAVIANEKGTNLFQKIKRAIVRRPIYRDHPDLKLYAPETVTMGNDKLIPLGVNDGLRRTERGLEFRPLLAPDGAVAVENDGCKYPSALFLLKKTGVVREGGWIEVRPFALASVGLTPTPNISGVDSLANAKTNTPAAKQTETPATPNNTMKQLLIGWLAAQGVALSNDSTDQQAWDKFIEKMGSQSTTVTALGNDKATLTQTVNSLTGDKAKLVQGATLPANLVEAANTILTLGNVQTDFKAERKARCEAVVDLQIGMGRLAVADREAEVTKLVALDNSKLAEAITALDKLPVKFPVGSQIGGGRKTEANATTVEEAQNRILHLANHDERYLKLPMADAMKAIEKDHAALFEQLRAKPGTTTTATAATT